MPRDKQTCKKPSLAPSTHAPRLLNTQQDMFFCFLLWRVYKDYTEEQTPSHHIHRGNCAQLKQVFMLKAI
jgi:hypothetical protein